MSENTVLSFTERVRERAALGLFACVGLDPRFDQIPKSVKQQALKDLGHELDPDGVIIATDEPLGGFGLGLGLHLGPLIWYKFAAQRFQLVTYASEYSGSEEKCRERKSRKETFRTISFGLPCRRLNDHYSCERWRALAQ